MKPSKPRLSNMYQNLPEESYAPVKSDTYLPEAERTDETKLTGG